jgi:hypothetical protein
MNTWARRKRLDTLAFLLKKDDHPVSILLKEEKANGC